MSAISHQWIMRIPLLLAGAFSFGFVFSAQQETDIILGLLLIGLASAGEWLEVQLGPLGTFTLRHVVALVALWIGGPALLMLVGLVPVLLVRLPAKKTSIYDAVSFAGKDALSFWFAYFAYFVASRWLNPSATENVLLEASARLVSYLAFWTIQIPLQALELNLSEGIRYRSVAMHLARRAAPHVATLSVAAILLSYIGTSFSYVVMGMATIVLIEAYYPWKLLGDQGGVLLTSVQMMAQAVDLKDPYTSNHSQRVSRNAVRIARAMGLPEDEVERIRIGGLMHDIGKIGISGRIIRKPGKLTPEEMALMMRHSSVSADIIEHLEILGESAEMVRHHHEHFDGSGYPDGLKGEEIPLGSRIILAADAFDAITTDRPYRKGASKTEAVAIIRKHAGTQFDTAVVNALERIAPSL